MPAPSRPEGHRICCDCSHSEMIAGYLGCLKMGPEGEDDPIRRWIRSSDWDNEGFPRTTPGPCPGWQDAAAP